jgi:tetratricopeptide (TPR) repeat protein
MEFQRRRGLGFAGALALAALAAAPGVVTQAGGMGGQTQQQQRQEQQPSTTPPAAQAPQNPAPQEPPRDPEEEKAYKAFYDTSLQDEDKQIELGEAFLQKYPQSRYREGVYARLAQVYFHKQQLEKMYDYGDKALALNPDDVTVLTMIGWVIPHGSDLDDAKLKKAETYEKHALEKLNTMPKPAGMTDEQFAKAKAQGLSQAHSGLGLVYFRENKPEDSINELKLASAGASPDPTDLYVMGVELQKLDRAGEAAEAFQKCAQTPSGVQSRCKQGVEDASKKKAAKP